MQIFGVTTIAVIVRGKSRGAVTIVSGWNGCMRNAIRTLFGSYCPPLEPGRCVKTKRQRQIVRRERIETTAARSPTLRTKD